jgi:hypothetical protein
VVLFKEHQRDSNLLQAGGARLASAGFASRLNGG